MTAAHVRAAATAERAIAKHGRQMALVPAGESSDQPWKKSTPGTPIPIVAMALPFGGDTQFGFREIEGNLNPATDRLYLLDARVEPLLSMRLRDRGPGGEGHDFAIVAVDPLEPGDVAILYRLIARL